MNAREGSCRGRMIEYIRECLGIVHPLIDLGHDAPENHLEALLKFMGTDLDRLYDLLQTLEQIEENRCANSGDQNFIK